MSKGTHFVGQPLYGQLIKLLDKSKILRLSYSHGGERYVKSFDGWHHLIVMLYAVIRRFDSLREIEVSMLSDARKLNHLGLKTMPRRSTLSDANARRTEAFFGAVYADLYATYRNTLSSDSSTKKSPNWMKRLQIIDSTTISLFSNLLFKGVGRNPKMGKKKGGIKVHTVIHANEGVPTDIQFTSAAKHDHFMLVPKNFTKGDIVALDRAYINYEKFEELTQAGVLYVTKMKKNLNYELQNDMMYQNVDGLMAFRVQQVQFTKKLENKTIYHQARIITYPDIKKRKLITLLTNDFKFEPEEIIAIYKKRWAIESLFKQIKQNFPLRYFYGESSNAIKIQIWVTLIANLLLTIIQRNLKKSWSFSGLATMVRILLMRYIDYNSFFEHPEKDWKLWLERLIKPPTQPSLFD